MNCSRKLFFFSILHYSMGHCIHSYHYLMLITNVWLQWWMLDLDFFKWNENGTFVVNHTPTFNTCVIIPSIDNVGRNWKLWPIYHSIFHSPLWNHRMHHYESVSFIVWINNTFRKCQLINHPVYITYNCKLYSREVRGSELEDWIKQVYKGLIKDKCSSQLECLIKPYLVWRSVGYGGLRTDSVVPPVLELLGSKLYQQLILMPLHFCKLITCLGQ